MNMNTENKNDNKKLIIYILIALVVIGGLVGIILKVGKNREMRAIDSFEKCAEKYPVQASYPAKCLTPDGRQFVQKLTEKEQENLLPMEY